MRMNSNWQQRGEGILSHATCREKGKGVVVSLRSSFKLQVKLGQKRNSFSYLNVDIGFWH